jgi:DNA-binding beta-propeller fold protein YncE
MKALVCVLALLTAPPAFGGLQYLTTLGKDEKLYQPSGVAATDDFVYILDTGPVKRVLRYKIHRRKNQVLPIFFEFDGSFGHIGQNVLTYPLGIAVGEDRVYVTDYSDRVFMFTLGGGSAGTFGKSGFEKGQLSYPRHVALDSDGRVYVVDSRNNRVQKFTREGTFLKQWGTVGTGNGQFLQSGASGIAIDSQNNVYIADELAHRIQKFTNTGQFLKTWGTVGSQAGELENPDGLACDPQDVLYVSEPGLNTHRVQLFDTEGTSLRVLPGKGPATESFMSPHAVATNLTGEVFIADAGTSEVVVFQDVKPDLFISSNQELPPVIKAHRFGFTVRYNQTFESCRATGGGRVIFPDGESFDFRVPEFRIPPSKPVLAISSRLAAAEVKRLQEVATKDQRITVVIRIAADCTDRRTVRAREHFGY